MFAASSLPEHEPLIIAIMIGILVLAGWVMDTTPNIVILALIMLPLIMMLTSLRAGFNTPLPGLNLSAVSGLTEEPILKVATKGVPYALAMATVALTLAFVAPVSLRALD